MKKSKFLQSVGNGDNRLYYHSLFGNLFLLEKDYIDVLESPDIDSIKLSSLEIIRDLSKAYFIIEDNQNERLILDDMKKHFLSNLINGGLITSLDLNISELCNFTCSHCMNGCEILDPKNKLMDWATAKIAIDEYKKIINKNNVDGEIHFGSAEPLINWNVIRESVLYCKKEVQNATLSINTNLGLLTEEIALFFKENNVYIASSLDGEKNGNDKIRTSLQGGTFDTIMEKIHLLKKIEYPLDGISTTMNDLNIYDIDDDFVLFIKNLGFSGFATDIDLVNNINCNNNVQFYIKKLLKIYKESKKMGIDNYGSWSSVYTNLINQEPDELLTFCKAQSGRNLSVNPQGDIFICGYSTSKVGNIFNFSNFFSSDNLYYKLIESRLPGKNQLCIGCKLEGICSGQCLVTHEFSETQKEKDKRIDFLCEFYIDITESLLELRLEN